MITPWLRVIRVRFLLASVIAVSVGLAITWWHTSSVTIFDAILTASSQTRLMMSAFGSSYQLKIPEAKKKCDNPALLRCLVI